MGVEDDRVAGGDHVDDIAGEGGDRVGDGQDRADDAEGCVFLEGDAAIAAHGIRVEPLGAGDIFGDLEFGDLVIDAADFCFVHFEASPRLGIADGEAFHDFDHLRAACDAEFLELLVGVVGGVGGLIDAVEDAELAGATTAAAGACGR